MKFSIDYTGGTTWSIRFEDPNVTAAQVRDGARDARPGGRHGRHDGHRLFRHPPVQARSARSGAVADARADRGRRPRRRRPRRPLPRLAPGATATPAPTPAPASARPTPRRHRPRHPTATPSPSIRARRIASRLTERLGRSRVGNTQVPTTGEIGRIAAGLQAALGPDRGAAVVELHRSGRQHRPHQPGDRPDPRGQSRDPGLDHASVPGREDGRHGARGAAP